MLTVITIAAIAGLAFAVGVGVLVYGQARRNLDGMGWYAVMSFCIASFTFALALRSASQDPAMHELVLRICCLLCFPYFISLLSLYHHSAGRSYNTVDWSLVISSALVFLYSAFNPDGFSDGTAMQVKQVDTVGGAIWIPALQPNVWLLRVFFLLAGLYPVRCTFLVWVMRGRRDRVTTGLLLFLAISLLLAAIYHFGLLNNLWSGIPVAPIVFMIAYIMLGVEMFRRERELIVENLSLIAEQENSERTLRLLVQGTSAVTGSDFFASLTQKLSEAMGFRYVLVGQLLDDESIQTISVFGDGKPLDNVRYDLAETPCAEVVRPKLCFYEDGVQQLFPDDKLLVEMGIVSYVGVPLIGSTGQPLGLLTALHDHPTKFRSDLQSTFEIFAARAAAELERTFAERQLRESELRFRTLATHAPVGIAVADSSGFPTYVNAECARIAGLPEEQCLGPGWMQSLHPEDRDSTIALWENAISRGDSFYVEHRCLWPDGGICWVRVLGVPQKDDSGAIEGWFCMILDQTEQQLARQQHEEQQAMLAHASRLSTMGEMMAGIAHELGQPLSSISNYAAACERSLTGGDGGLDAPLEKCLSEISELAVRCGEIIRGTREFLQKNDDQREWIDINEVVRESIDLVSSDGSQRDMSIVCDLPAEGPRVVANKVQLQQVIVNLLRNARDATVGQTDPQVHVSVLSRDSEIGLTVEDNGTGIAPELRGRLFDTFFTTKPEGLGMGLSISKTIIEAHHGRLRLGTAEGTGAKFSIQLPLEKESVSYIE